MGCGLFISLIVQSTGVIGSKYEESSRTLLLPTVEEMQIKWEANWSPFEKKMYNKPWPFLSFFLSFSLSNAAKRRRRHVHTTGIQQQASQKHPHHCHFTAVLRHLSPICHNEKSKSLFIRACHSIADKDQRHIQHHTADAARKRDASSMSACWFPMAVSAPILVYIHILTCHTQIRASDRSYWDGWVSKSFFMRKDGRFTRKNVQIGQGESVCVAVLVSPSVYILIWQPWKPLFAL